MIESVLTKDDGEVIMEDTEANRQLIGELIVFSTWLIWILVAILGVKL